MNKRTKELAEQAGLYWGIQATHENELERFAELIRADERDKCAQDYLQDCCDAVEAARLEEREKCGNLVANMGNGIESMKYAEAIWQRGEK